MDKFNDSGGCLGPFEDVELCVAQQDSCCGRIQASNRRPKNCSSVDFEQLLSIIDSY